ncbi:uncharacterized protein DUF4440 [Mesorhizobium sp. J18]|uniref:nuclear transport factor 2 family protein n=1 Tax=Mesorhizobium sp. J18 TaxID=935263 RepID=UPI0011993569|nr:nuclear transport factor 2 family protein [Mesorhizobium sp. J18]TWG94954.1 uncharacterized protein DUF4440 [Mesorhizobium sp. J18]
MGNIGSICRSGYLIVMAIITTTVPTRAGDADIISAWYEALTAVDRERLAELLADDARIQLDDLGVEQSKAEFIEALDEWEAAADGADIRYRIEDERMGQVTVNICYDFPNNDVLMRELFRIEADKIQENVQSNISDNCGDL